MKSSRIGLEDEDLVPVEEDHLSIARFNTPENQTFKLICLKIQKLLKTSNATTTGAIGQAPESKSIGIRLRFSSFVSKLIIHRSENESQSQKRTLRETR